MTQLEGIQMQKVCDFCDNAFKDGADVGFIASGTYRQIPSKVNFALDKEFVVDELYHPECLRYVLGGGK